MHMQLAFVLTVLLQGSKICFPQHEARSIAASFASQQTHNGASEDSDES